MQPRVVIDGREETNGCSRLRPLVLVNGTRICLQPALFRIMALLAFWRKLDVNGGWIHREKLDRENATRYCHRLRQVVGEFIDWPVMENDRRGRYRILTIRSKVFFPNLQALRGFGDYEVEMMTACLENPGMTTNMEDKTIGLNN